MRLGIVGDIHAPFTHPGYLAFVLDTLRKYRVDAVHLIGDVVDWHGISFHPRHPEAPGVMEEYQMAKAAVAEWHRAIRKARVSIGNHDERIVRLAASVQIPEAFVRAYSDLWGTPGWTWEYETLYQSDEVLCFHGTGCGGEHPAFNVMRKRAMSVIMGHVHSASGIKRMANPAKRFFAMDTGCGVDDRAVAMAYGRYNQKKSVLGMALLLDGQPVSLEMPCGRGEPYDRKRFKEPKWQKAITTVQVAVTSPAGRRRSSGSARAQSSSPPSTRAASSTVRTKARSARRSRSSR